MPMFSRRSVIKCVDATGAQRHQSQGVLALDLDPRFCRQTNLFLLEICERRFLSDRVGYSAHLTLPCKKLSNVQLI